MSEQHSVPEVFTEKADGGRFPLLAPAALDDEQLALYTTIAGPPRAGGPFLVVDDDGHLAGPFNALLYAPQIGQAVQALGAALRFGGKLPSRTRELVICAVATERCSAYEWYAHSRVARTVGITEAELESLRGGFVPDGLPADERSALTFTAALLNGRSVAVEDHADALAHHGHSGVTELAILVGYYRALSGLLAAGDVNAPAVNAPAAPTSHPQSHLTTTTKGEHQ
ncbi:carboxymuconolactone decarboxylase family protein [Arthrobacter sp. H20]|uniref:carboxymuconolactone decarboxylase family protein n=1 Tax=Arthrobacter sp. H20 TaxID=1267981 RepID=UPI0004B92FA6|nr:carboxymuconolactone decarboxylase family protein [Arthrobacter sp. H20]